APQAGSGLIRPAYGSASLADVLPGVLAALGVPGSADPLNLTEALAGAQSVVVLLIDGLGYHALAGLSAQTATLHDIVAGRMPGASLRPITTGFPSTTPTSVVSLSTGAAPGSHGLVGFSLNVPGTDRVLNHLLWEDEPDPQLWQPLPTQFSLAAKA